MFHNRENNQVMESMANRETELESAIDSAALWLATAKTHEERARAFACLRELVNQRSAARVEEMEKARGLR